MRGESYRPSRKGWRALAGATTGLGAVAVVAVFALSGIASAGVARPNSFPGAWWAPSVYRDVYGCAQAHGYPGKWAELTGKGSMKISDFAKECPAFRGGPNVSSYGELGDDMEYNIPVTGLSSSTGGVNVTMNISYAELLTASPNATSVPCPILYYNYSFLENLSYAIPGYVYWFNETEVYSDCYVQSSIDFFAYAYLYDSSADWYQYSSGPFEFYNYTEAGGENYSDNFSYSEQWLNSTYYSYNYSYAYNYSYVYNYGSAVNTHGYWNPEFFFNASGASGGAFSSTDQYNIWLYAEASGYASGYQLPGYKASGSLDMSGTTHHMDIKPLSIW